MPDSMPSLLAGFVALLLLGTAQAEDYDIKVESPLLHATALPEVGFYFVNPKHWGAGAKAQARRAMKGIPETPSGIIRLYRVFPGTEYTNQFQLYLQYKSLLYLIVDEAHGTVLGADFFINRKNARLGDTARLIVKMRQQIGLNF